MDLADLTATEAAARIARRGITSVELVTAGLARIEAREPEVQAWVHLDPEHALKQARAADAAQAAGTPLGPLHGIPVGIKDIIDTGDMPTQHGSPHYTGHRPEHDASCIETLKAAGAVIMGKTVTTELATLTPNKTRNPHNPKHTPGGSSSGSAAAVACGMVPLALGTQTGGSVVRPGSFCGVHALKPTLGLISRTGVYMQAHTLDTVGVYARSLADIALITNTLDTCDPTDPVSYPRSASTVLKAATSAETISKPPRIGFLKTPAWPQAEPGAKAAIEALAGRLGEGCSKIELPRAFDDVIEDHKAVQVVENDFHFNPLMEKNAELISPGLRERIAAGTTMQPRRYLTALHRRDQHYAMVNDALGKVDALLCLSSTGPAPASLENTGNPVFNGLWTFLGVPTVSLPLLSVDGMPCGVTLVGRRRDEPRLLAIAKWVEDAVG